MNTPSQCPHTKDRKDQSQECPHSQESYTSEIPGLKNNLSQQEIEALPFFQEITKIAEQFWEKIIPLHLNEEYNNQVSDFPKELQGYNIQDIRMLKQSLNNTVCLKIFQAFLEDIDQLWEHELFSYNLNHEKKTFNLIELDIDDFLNLSDSVTKQWINHNNKSTWNKAIDATVLDILKLVPKKLLHSLFPEKILWIREKYIRVFNYMIHRIFKEYLLYTCEQESVRQVFKTYLLLEEYTDAYFYREDWESFSSWTNIIIPVNHCHDIITWIHEWYWSNEIDQKLKQQTKIDMHDSLYSKVWAMQRNNNVHGIDEEYVLSWKDREVLVWGCPFAKSKIDWDSKFNWKNAFNTMFGLFDEYMIKILRELEKRWI